MVALNSLPPRRSRPPLPLSTDDRHLRKLLSPRNLLSRHPSVILSLSLLGMCSLSILTFHLLSLLFHPSLHSHHLTSPVAPPPPIFVIAGGAPRTGSTFVFNILRILMRIRDPNTVASSNWMLAKLVPENKTLEQYDRIALLRTMATSILVKVHTAKQYYDFVGPLHSHKFADEVDLLVTGYRDLRHETVSAFKMFAKNRTEWAADQKWSDMCQALIRRRNSLIKEAASVVPILDIRYEDWRDGGDPALLQLIRHLAAHIPWHYTDHDIHATLAEVKRMKVPAGGELGNRVEWHLSNLMSPKHISAEHLSEDFIKKGIRAVVNEPTCFQWLKDKHYM